MDETILHDAPDLNSLTPEDERLLARFTDTVIIEEGAVVPTFLAALPTLTCSTPPELVDGIYQLQSDKRLVVVTKTKMTADLARVLNQSFGDNHLALYENETWDAAQALEEIRRISSMLTDESGKTIYVETEIIPGIYTSTDGKLLAAGDTLSELGGQKLYDKRFRDFWGTILPTPFTKELLADDTLDFTTRTLAAVNLHAQIKLRNDSMLPAPECTLVFRTGHALVTGWETPDDRDAAIRRLFFLLLFGAEETGDVLGAMLPVLTAAKDVPAPFLSDLEHIYLGGSVCSFRKWNNIFERLMLDYEELGILKGGAAE